MKKLLAVFLAIICAFSAISVCAINTDELEDIIGGQLGLPEQEEDEAEKLSYGIHYELAPLTQVSVLYMPSPSITFEVPKEMTVTTDTPVSADYTWIAWKHSETGELYYPGDTILVEGKVVLYAVWEEKTDTYPSFIRMAIAGVQALMNLIRKFFSVFDLINSTTPPAETTTVAA